MADKKTLHIKADFKDTGTDSVSESLDESAAKAQALAEQMALLTTYVADTTGATGTPQDFEPEKKETKKKGKVEEEEKKAEEHLGVINRILFETQKVITALNGTNGRVTKAMAAFRRSVALTTEKFESFRASRAAAAAAGGAGGGSPPGTGPVGAGAANAGKAMGKLAAGALAGGAALAKLGKIGLVTGVVFGAFSAAVALASKLLVRFNNSLEDVVGKFSAALNVANAMTKVAEIQQQMRSANKVGGELASLENSTREVIVGLNEFKTQMIDLLSGNLEILTNLLSLLLKAVNTVLDWLNSFFEWLNEFSVNILRLVESIPGIGRAAKAAADWLEKDRIAQIEKDNSVHALIEPLGDIENIGIHKNARDELIRKGFL